MIYESSLYHHGIKGQHWGKRNGPPYPLDQKKASNYSSQQRKRDSRIYGKRSEKRINKRMVNGESIQSARHAEVVRKNRIDSGKAIAKRVAKGALVVGGAAAVTKILQQNGVGSKASSELIQDNVVKVGRQVINGIFGKK